MKARVILNAAVYHSELSRFKSNPPALWKSSALDNKEGGAEGVAREVRKGPLDWFARWSPSILTTERHGIA